jgi:hypothetical protein
MTQIAEIDGTSTVILGSFNPAISHPSWYEKQGLISEADAENTEIKVVVPDVSEIKIGSIRVQVVRDRFTVETADPRYFESVRDLALGTFAVLEHTPVKALGINRNMHFRMGSIDKQRAFLKLLVHSETWNTVFDSPEFNSLTMRHNRTDPPGFLAVKIEPSVRIDPGVFIQMNNHYDIADNGIAELLRNLKDNWEQSIHDASKLANNLLSKDY